MKRFRVIIVPRVKEQIRAQLIFIAHHSVDNALAWEDRLLAAIKSIGNLATGHPVDEPASRRIGEGIRKMVFEKTYLVHYRVDQKQHSVEILNFRHGSRLPRPGEP